MKTIKEINKKIKASTKAIKNLNDFSRIDKQISKVAKNFLRKMINKVKYK